MVTVDRLQTVAASQILADAATNNPSRDYVGQTFVAADSQLDTIDFFIDSSGSGGPAPFRYRLLVVSVKTDANGFHPDKVLFESGMLTEPVDGNFANHKVTVDVGDLKLTKGATYAFILDGFRERDGSETPMLVAESHDSTGSDVANYLGGHAVKLQADYAETRSQHFADDWEELNGSGQPDVDLAFRLVFSTAPPPVTINGTKRADLIDADHKPKGQPAPSAADDLISGFAKNDKLFGLLGDDTLNGGTGKDALFGGDGNDRLIGGKDRDKLYGEAGDDRFVFNTKIKGPPDKLMDFVPGQDTIELSRTIFKALPAGPLQAAAFNAGGQQQNDDRILYQNGKLSYDQDGKGGHDPKTFAKVIGGVVLTEADFIVV